MNPHTVLDRQSEKDEGATVWTGAGSSMLPCSRLELEFLSYSEVILVKVGGQIILCSTALA